MPSMSGGIVRSKVPTEATAKDLLPKNKLCGHHNHGQVFPAVVTGGKGVKWTKCRSETVRPRITTEPDGDRARHPKYPCSPAAEAPRAEGVSLNRHSWHRLAEAAPASLYRETSGPEGCSHSLETVLLDTARQGRLVAASNHCRAAPHLQSLNTGSSAPTAPAARAEALRYHPYAANGVAGRKQPL
jgi:hypothetical protein